MVETPDITKYLDFTFYDWIKKCTHAGLDKLSIGRWLGVSHKVGQMMSYWQIISCVTLQQLKIQKETMMNGHKK